MENQVIEAIRQRRSVRRFTEEPVSPEDLTAVLEAGRWAPSGENNQPWRFVIVEGREKKEELAALTRSSRVIKEAAVCLAVFLDKEACYHLVKDSQATGACLQNMLLAAHARGLGAVWLGEILKNSERVRECLGLSPMMELQAVVALGHPQHRRQTSERRPLDELIVGRF
ncbi:MAG: nitroreductase family protein [Thermodesulfobacteriota bacterium]